MRDLWVYPSFDRDRTSIAYLSIALEEFGDIVILGNKKESLYCWIAHPSHVSHHFVDARIRGYGSLRSHIVPHNDGTVPHPRRKRKKNSPRRWASAEWYCRFGIGILLCSRSNGLHHQFLDLFPPSDSRFLVFFQRFHIVSWHCRSSDLLSRALFV